jgi:hypothetical protein
MPQQIQEKCNTMSHCEAVRRKRTHGTGIMKECKQTVLLIAVEDESKAIPVKGFGGL